MAFFNELSYQDKLSYLLVIQKKKTVSWRCLEKPLKLHGERIGNQ